MPIGKLFGINPAQAATNPFQVSKHDDNELKQAFNFENANPNRPAHRGDGIHGCNLYCLG